ncbi:MAG TPA: hypothetical protein VFD58_35985 [Blastocatellia bacterium]|nr:hypothetical protein [Blastocatellia bacterium]
MSQLLTLFWLRYVIFRNSVTGAKEIFSAVLRLIILLGYLLLSLGAGVVLFVAMVAMPDTLGSFMANSMGTIFGMLVFLTLITQATGTSANFDPRRFILFPVSFKKLFALNLISALAEPVMITLLPSVAGILIGRGVALRHPLAGLTAFVCAALWINALFVLIALVTAWLLSGRKRRTEIFFTVVMGLFLLVSQILPRMIGTSFGSSLWDFLQPYREGMGEIFSWTPFGVWGKFFEILKRHDASGAFERLLAVSVVWTGMAWAAGYAVFTRLATSARSGTSGSARNAEVSAPSQRLALRLPFVSEQLSAIFAKEITYLMRNTVTWLNTANILVITLLAFRPVQYGLQRGFRRGEDLSRLERLPYAQIPWGEIWWIMMVVLFPFMVNFQYFSSLFAFDASGFRQYLLAPVSWLRVLLGKNLAIWVMVAAQMSLIVLGTLVFYGNLTPGKVYLLGCALITVVVSCSLVGNLLSIHFPYPAEFGIRRRRSRSGYEAVSIFAIVGVLLGNAGLIILPAVLGWLFGGPGLRYLSATAIVLIACVIYGLSLGGQSRRLEAKRFDIAEALTRKTEKI